MATQAPVSSTTGRNVKLRSKPDKPSAPPAHSIAAAPAARSADPEELDLTTLTPINAREFHRRAIELRVMLDAATPAGAYNSKTPAAVLAEDSHEPFAYGCNGNAAEWDEAIGQLIWGAELMLSAALSRGVETAMRRQHGSSPSGEEAADSPADPALT